MENEESTLKTTVPEQYYSQERDSAAINRREFLKSAGRFAVYTPPALMLLMQPGYAKIAKSGGQGKGNFSGLLQKNHSKSIFRILLDRLYQILRQRRA
jgi:hypothetical protein